MSFVTQFFRPLALNVANGANLPNLPLVFTGHPLEKKPRQELIGLADQLLPQAVTRITAPAKGAETPQPREA